MSGGARRVVLVYLTLPESGEVRGGARSVLLTARHLSRYRAVFVLNRESALAADARAAGLEVRVLPTTRILDGLRAASWTERLRRVLEGAAHDVALVRTARELGAQVLHCQDPSEAITVGLAARAAGIPVLLHLRDGPRLRRWRLSTVVASAAASRAVCVSEGTRASYLTAAPWPLRRWFARRSLAIPNGLEFDVVDGERARTAPVDARRTLGLPRDAWILAVVGPLSWKKNQLPFLEQAAGGLLGLGDDVRLVFVGSERFDSGYTRECRAVVDRLSARDRVLFLGEVPYNTMGAVYSASDVILVPSRVEGLPRVALEAQAWGRPLVASRIPGNASAIVEGCGGFLVDLERLDEMVERVARLRDPLEYRRMSEAGRGYVRENFDVRSVTPRVEALYDELCR